MSHHLMICHPRQMYDHQCDCCHPQVHHLYLIDFGLSKKCPERLSSVPGATGVFSAKQIPWRSAFCFSAVQKVYQQRKD